MRRVIDVAAVLDAVLDDLGLLLVAVGLRDGLWLCLFAPDGRPIEVREWTLPPECKAEPDDPYGVYNRAALQAYLHQEYGFRPGRIRISDLMEVYHGLSFGDIPSHVQEHLGALDDPEEWPEQSDELCGHAAICYRWVRGDVYRLHVHGIDRDVNGVTAGGLDERIQKIDLAAE